MASYCSMVFYVCRHGITRANQEKRYLGWTDVSITDEARRQMEGKALPEARWYVSDFTRCIQTAEVLLNRPFCITEALREYCFGEWEMKTYDTLKTNPRYRKWIDDPERIQPPGGEAMEAFQHRLLSFWREVEGTAPAVGIVAHGGSIRELLFLLGFTASRWEASVPHGGLLRLDLQQSEEGWTCTSLSAAPLLEHSKQHRTAIRKRL
ncbi:histidine phosphatase family protein [Alkalicoccus urumqiensis]|uniref:Histidine phosphatase family protein n=1 Tax=Alkalicoccus urumqiensis TaxID=1548213 RepID=A0A2P6MIB4_ALKUR|nr:histidine phosphatase family protein [Alkalicoccus urumqiensis]PRO65997.1 histidine phosphatase family protein [Alkalicoccus urumqiensis]